MCQERVVLHDLTRRRRIAWVRKNRRLRLDPEQFPACENHVNRELWNTQATATIKCDPRKMKPRP
jgi:hypothetical protein